MDEADAGRRRSEMGGLAQLDTGGAMLKGKAEEVEKGRLKQGVREVAQRVRGARKRAGLTQVELAKRLGRSQTLVSQAESGVARVGENYVRMVLAACDLPRNFGAPKRRRAELEAHEIAGFDPETLKPVRRGSRRDKELGRKLVWWNNRWGG